MQNPDLDGAMHASYRETVDCVADPPHGWNPSRVQLGSGACDGFVKAYQSRYGGDMHASVIAALFEALPEAGVATLRFNFRGVGASGGRHDDGRAEVLDIEAALADLAVAAPVHPVVVAGWSFGADVALSVVDPHLDGWCCIAAPLTLGEQPPAASDERPKLARMIHPFAALIGIRG